MPYFVWRELFGPIKNWHFYFFSRLKHLKGLHFAQNMQILISLRVGLFYDHKACKHK